MKTERVEMRVTADDKERYKRMAQHHGLTLTDFFLFAADTAVEGKGGWDKWADKIYQR